MFKLPKGRQPTVLESSYFATARNDIEASLQALRQTLPSLPSFAINREDLLRIAEVKRLTALLFLRERLGNPNVPANIRPGDIPFYDNISTPNAIVPGAVETSLSACKSRLVSAIISLISTLPDSATLLWPLFVVGNSGLDDEEQRRFVLERLEDIQKTRNLGSVRRARMVVEDAYRARDLDHPRGKVWGHEGPGIISLA
jgi:anaphase-promoting complex subunit 1